MDCSASGFTGCSYPLSGAVTEDAAAGRVTKPVTFALIEDYDKGQDLDAIERDFQLMQELRDYPNLLSSLHDAFNGTTLRTVTLKAGQVAIFRITP